MTINNEKLKKEIENRSKEVFTDSYSLSLSELINRYKDWDIVIPPKLQRVFRWTKYQKTRLIESLLLKIPIPAIFVSEDSEQKWEIIDWLQRMSTIFEFIWSLESDNKISNPIKEWLFDWEYLPLNWTKWDTLWDEWKRRIKNTRITINIIQKDSDPNAKFDLFSRLNDWWTQLSSQETRNCIILMLDESFYDWLLELSKNNDFIELTNFSDKALSTKDDMEFVLRYFCAKFYNEKSDKFSDVKTFLDNKSRELIQNKSFDREKEKIIFESVFKKLNKCLWVDAFHRYNWKEFTNRFNYTWFDSIAQWLAYNYWSNILEVDETKLKNRIEEMWNIEFNNETDSNSWSSSEYKLKFCSKYWKEYFSNIK